MTLGIVLAAGKGTRLKCTDRNKTSLEVGGKPLVAYGVELYQKTVDHTLVVVGAFGESVQEALSAYDVTYAWQMEQKGTGHAAQVAVEAIINAGLKPDHVFIGYGDHMMFYTPEMVEALMKTHQDSGAAITLVTTHHENPDALAWGRIVRDEDNFVQKIVEQKDATPEERAIEELNAGFYCMEYEFLQEAIQQLVPSPVTGEFYLTDLISLAQASNRSVAAYAVPYEMVGSGINTPDQLQEIDAQIAPNLSLA